MDQIRQQLRAPAPAIRTEQVLERYYGQLVEWGTLLTRGDEVKAQDLVHDFCLHFAVTKPDLSGVTNLDGYLYKSLRHIYLSGLARSSREALQFVNTAEFDSIQLALVPRQLSDLLQRQNDLRSICCYGVWRKAQTKGASYFILRFFHGYHHQEIADLACTNLTAIYSKFRRFRVEVRSYLEEPGKLQFTSRELPPSPPLRWTPVSSIELFKELRKSILDARTGDCLPEEELIALYTSEHSRPISCSLLSHIVSCERCLALVDSHLRRPTLKDREPLDQISDGAGAGVDKPVGTSREKVLRSIQRYETEILEHRPRTLSIAVDGKILASHDVQAQRNVLSARIERPENASFVEVFSEQGIRLALISIGDLPPEGPHGQTQRVALSDGRWLDLTLSFDGLGMNSEVVYSDPALASEVMDEDDEEELVRVLLRPELNRAGEGKILPWPSATAWLTSIRRFLRPVTPSPVVAWSLVIACVFCVAGYFVLRSDKTVPALNAREVLNRSIQAEAASLEGQTEHQVFRFEEATADGSILEQGTIDQWKDGDGKRYMRRLYDAQHRLIAAEWKQRDGDRGEYPMTGDSQPSGADRELLADNLWKQDVSPIAFRELNGGDAQIRTTEDGYELTATETGASHPQLVSATLVLDRHYHPIREVMRIRKGGEVREARFVEADYERRPASSVPYAIFDPVDQGLRSRSNRLPALPQSMTSDVQLAELHIAVLYQLGNLSADTNEPIEVEETHDRHVRVTGTLANDARKREILERLNLLPDHQLLQTELISPADIPKQGLKHPQAIAGAFNTYDVSETKAPADAALRKFFQSQGMSGTALDAAVIGFSRDALGHAQRALQHASALNRLGNTFSAMELSSVRPSSQQQWTELVARHATALEVELRALRDQLLPLTLVRAQVPNALELGPAVENPAQFGRRANQLLVRTQDLNRTVGSLFASSQSPPAQPPDLEMLVTTTSKAIPLEEAVEITSFAVQLNASGNTAAISRQHDRPEKQTPNRP